jgi:hypothetical protein
MAELPTVHRENYWGYGVKKMHQAMTRRGWKLGREQTRRLMRKARPARGATRKAIVSWIVSSTMRTEDLPLQAFNHAVWQSNSDLSELVHRSDADRSSYRWPVPTGWPNSGSHRQWGRGAMVTTTSSVKQSTPPNRPS